MANIYNFCLLAGGDLPGLCQDKGCTCGFFVAVYSDRYAMDFHLKVAIFWMHLEVGRNAGAEWDRGAGGSPTAAPRTA